jgi:prophage DNA circulation protein
MAVATRAQAEAVAAGKPQLRTFQVAADISLLAWAHARYSDSSRAAEVLALNPGIVDPLVIVAGTELLAYAE